MGPGFIVGAWPGEQDVSPETDCVEMKRAGFHHIRMHLGRTADKNLDGVMTEDEYFELLDRWITHMLRHGLYCHIGNGFRSGRGLVETDDGSPEWKALYHAEILDWYTKVAHHFKTRSHRLAYQIFLETSGKVSFVAKSSSLNAISYLFLVKSI
jgi:hypothetical protein